MNILERIYRVLERISHWAVWLGGLSLLLAAFSAAGLFLSSLTVNPVVAAVSSFGLLLLLWIINNAGSGEGENLLSQLSILAHFRPMLRGLINSADVAYFILFIATFLVLTIRQMDSQRLQA